MARCKIYISVLIFGLIANISVQAQSFAVFNVQDIDAEAIESADQEVSLEWVKKINPEITSGTNQSVVCKITNHTNEPVKAKLILGLPESWVLITGSKELNIPANSTIKSFSVFRVPSMYIAGPVNITAKLYDEQKDVIFSDDLITEITRNFRIQVTEKDQTKFVLAGKTFETTYIIENRGNSIIELDHKAYKSSLLSEEKVVLKPGESTEAKLSIETAKEVRKNQVWTYGLKIKGENFDTTVSKFGSTEVLPNYKNADSDGFERFPITLALNYLGRYNRGNYGSAIQADVFGRGTLNDSIKDELEFHFRLPDQLNFNNFGNFEEHYVKYNQSRFGIWVGDQNVTLTRLTEVGRYVRGISGNVNFGGLTVESFYGVPRFFPDIKEIAGASAKYTFKNNLYIGTAGMYKSFNVSTDSIGYVSSIVAGYSSTVFNLATEISSDIGVEQPSLDNRAYDININGRIKGFNYTANVLSAGKDYSGFFQNSLIGNVGVGYHWKKVSVGLTGSYFDSNPQLDTIQFRSAPYSINSFANLGYQIDKTTRAQVFAGFRRRKDRFILNLYDYYETVVRFQLDKEYNDNLKFTGQAEYQRNRNYISTFEDNISNGFSIWTNADYRLNQKVDFVFGVNYADNNRYNSSERFRRVIFNTAVNWNINYLSKLRVSYRSNFDIEEYGRAQDFFELGYYQTFNQKNEFSITSRYSKPRNTINAENLFLVATYRYRLDAPKARKKGLGKVAGTVTNIDDSTKMANVILHLGGNTTVTDENGYYEIPNLKPGRHYLTVERSSMEFGQITMNRQPVLIEILPDLTIKQDIEVSESACIKGQIHYTNGAARIQALQTQSRTYRPVYIELSNGKERFITSCDTTGIFKFNYIRPGNWKIKLMESTLDETMVYDKKTINIELKPGSDNKVTFKARKKEKKLKFVSPPIKLTAKRKTKSDGGTH